MSGKPKSRTEKFLSIERGDVVSFVGGGGKSMLMDSIARRLVKEDRKVLLAATRPFRLPPGGGTQFFLTGEEPLGNLKPILSEHGLVMLAPERSDDGLFGGYAPGALRIYAAKADYLFVEAEDARGLSLPPPAEPRPIPPDTSVLFLVAGLDALGPDLDCEAFGEKLAAPGGLLTCRTDIERRVLLLNKADRNSIRRDGALVAARAFEALEEAILRPKVVLTSIRDYLRPL